VQIPLDGSALVGLSTSGLGSTLNVPCPAFVTSTSKASSSADVERLPSWSPVSKPSASVAPLKPTGDSARPERGLAGKVAVVTDRSDERQWGG
jgi:hypothetical protein